MRRIVTAAALVVTAVLAAPHSASADPAPNGHNCVGVTDSSLAAPGFGQLVSSIATSSPGAIADSLDDFANCGNAP